MRARALRGLLWGAKWPYGLAVGLRNRAFDFGLKKIHRVDVPVICVGNLTTGGTGKTPLVAWIARWLLDHGVRPAIVSRGYGSSSGPNDEARELAQRLPNVPHIQNPDRVAAAREAIEHHSAEVIILDDGFQHRRLMRDLNIALIDAAAPFGYGHLLPRGLLREPLSGLVRADVVALSRADMADDETKQEIRATVARHAPHAAWCELSHRPHELLNSAGETRPLDHLAGFPLAAFCGIGNPAGFRHTLKACNYDVAAFREFPDHHAYTAIDIESLANWADTADAGAVVCTHKDMVKLGAVSLGSLPLWSLAVEVDVVAGGATLTEALHRITTSRPNA